MGNFMGFMGKGLPPTQLLSLMIGTIHKQFAEKEKTFEEFHIAILEILNNFNSALPGKHYDVPSVKDVEEFFNEWKAASDPEEKKEIFIKFMKRSVNLSRLDDSTMITGMVIPPAVMAAKRAGENLPHLKFVKVIPDVIFVPSLTVLGLISTKLTKRMFLGPGSLAT